MNHDLEELISLVKKLPKKEIKKVTTLINKIIAENQASITVPLCLYCQNCHVVKNGHKHNKQSYLCKYCGKSFVETTNTVMEKSHYDKSVWKQVISDTIRGVSLDETAKKLDLSHKTAFHMRHKILSALEMYEELHPTVLDGICELDDTYVLESLKGTKIPDDYYRKARKHGESAQKSGVSHECVSICAGIERKGKVYTKTVNRSTPTSANIKEVFDEHITQDALVLCDGAKSFKVLSNKRDVHNVKNHSGSEHFYHINTVNGYHSFIKARYKKYRGIATKYINRYNALFSRAYKSTSEIINFIYDLFPQTLSNGSLYISVRSIKTEKTLSI
jgi:transposase-like protein